MSTLTLKCSDKVNNNYECLQNNSEILFLFPRIKYMWIFMWMKRRILKFYKTAYNLKINLWPPISSRSSVMSEWAREREREKEWENVCASSCENA